MHGSDHSMDPLAPTPGQFSCQCYICMTVCVCLYIYIFVIIVIVEFLSVYFCTDRA